jgi:hypothetical protein
MVAGMDLYITLGLWPYVKKSRHSMNFSLAGSGSAFSEDNYSAMERYVFSSLLQYQKGGSTWKSINKNIQYFYCICLHW